jgi:hypothetical protein
MENSACEPENCLASLAASLFSPLCDNEEISKRVEKQKSGWISSTHLHHSIALA